MAKDDEKKELWVSWTQDALGNYQVAASDDLEDVVDEMVDAACTYADAMLEEYEKRFEGGSGRRTRKKKPVKDDDDEDD